GVAGLAAARPRASVATLGALATTPCQEVRRELSMSVGFCGGCCEGVVVADRAMGGSRRGGGQGGGAPGLGTGFRGQSRPPSRRTRRRLGFSVLGDTPRAAYDWEWSPGANGRTRHSCAQPPRCWVRSPSSRYSRTISPSPKTSRSEPPHGIQRPPDLQRRDRSGPPRNTILEMRGGLVVRSLGGRSPGFSPLRTLSTKLAACRRC